MWVYTLGCYLVCGMVHTLAIHSTWWTQRRNPGSWIKRECLLFFKYLCIYVCLYFTATPFNLPLRNFGTRFLMWLFKFVFSNLWKIVFLQSYCHFSLFHYELFVTLKSNHTKSSGDRNEVLFAHKLTCSKQKFARKMFAQKCPDFCVCLFVFQIVSPENYSQ